VDLTGPVSARVISSALTNNYFGAFVSGGSLLTQGTAYSTTSSDPNSAGIFATSTGAVDAGQGLAPAPVTGQATTSTGLNTFTGYGIGVAQAIVNDNNTANVPSGPNTLNSNGHIPAQNNTFTGATTYAGVEQQVRHRLDGFTLKGLVDYRNAVGVTAPQVTATTPFNTKPNGEDIPAQRSMIRGMRLVFDGPVTGLSTAGALNLLRDNGANPSYYTAAPNPPYATLPPNGNVGLVVGTPVVNGTTGTTTVDVTFLAGDPAVEAGANPSLKDGFYYRNVNGSLINLLFTNSGSAAQTVNLNPASNSPTFHRMFGDVDGNKAVNSADAFKFNEAVTVPGSMYFTYFDFNNDGLLNTTDQNEFIKRFNKTLVPQVP